MNAFKQRLKKGHKGEERMLELHPTWTRMDGFREDFKTADGLKVELKTEYRAAKDWPRIVVEIARDSQNPGALYRSILHEIDIICWLFYEDSQYFMYNPIALEAHIKEFGHKYDKKRIHQANGLYNTIILVPRKDIQHLCLN